MLPIILLLSVTGALAATTCGENEQFYECGSSCIRTCENRHQEALPCIEKCVENVCQCAPGFVRHEGKCIAGFDCPKQCQENEELLQCGSACEPNCAEPYPVICTQQCLVNVCQCKRGFVRNSDGKCVVVAECPKVEPKPEVDENEYEERHDYD